MSLLQFLKLGNAMGKVRGQSAYQLGKKPNFVPEFSSAGRPAGAQPPAQFSKVDGANPFVASEGQSELLLLAPMRSEGQAEIAASVDAAPMVPAPAVVTAEVTPVSPAPGLPKAPPGSTIPAKRYVRPTAPPDELGQKAWGLLGSRLFGGSAIRR